MSQILFVSRYSLFMTALEVPPETPLHVRLAMAREVAGIGQSDIARQLGVSRATVSLWERGMRCPRFSQGVQWAAVTQQPVIFFAEGVEV